MACDFRRQRHCLSGQQSKIPSWSTEQRCLAARTAAANFAKLPPATVYVVERGEGISWTACAITAGTSPLNASLVRQMQQPALVNARGLPALLDADGHLSLQSLRFHVDDIVYPKLLLTILEGVASAAGRLRIVCVCVCLGVLRRIGFPIFANVANARPVPPAPDFFCCRDGS